MAGNDTSQFDEVLKAAHSIDFIVAVFGIDTSQEFETGTRKSIELPGVQNRLLKSLSDYNKKLIVVLLGGSAMVVPEVLETVVTQ